jgi:hypothetical protein
MSNAKIKMPKHLGGYLCPCAGIPECRVGIWVLKVDIHFSPLQKSGKREDATEERFAGGSFELWNLSI